jgi:hypothetical protein
LIFDYPVGKLAAYFVGAVSGGDQRGFLSTDALGVLLDALLRLSSCLACIVPVHRGLAALASFGKPVAARLTINPTVWAVLPQAARASSGFRCDHTGIIPESSRRIQQKTAPGQTPGRGCVRVDGLLCYQFRQKGTS